MVHVKLHRDSVGDNSVPGSCEGASEQVIPALECKPMLWVISPGQYTERQVTRGCHHPETVLPDQHNASLEEKPFTGRVLIFMFDWLTIQRAVIGSEWSLKLATSSPLSV